MEMMRGGDGAGSGTFEERQRERAEVEALAGRVCAAASLSAQSAARLVELVGEFDAAEGVRFFDGCGTTARWLAWACSMSPGVAREHVRVARALRQMPVVAASFAAGRLSYSKVRAVTRLVGQVEEAELVELAETMTAAQLDVTVSGFRTAAGTRIRQEDRRRVGWSDRGSGMVAVTAQLPVEEAAVVIAAIEAARDRQPVDDRCTVDALVEVARSFLAAGPTDVSGEDRTQVVVQVSAEALAATLAPAAVSVPGAAGPSFDAVPVEGSDPLQPPSVATVDGEPGAPTAGGVPAGMVPPLADGGRPAERVTPPGNGGFLAEAAEAAGTAGAAGTAEIGGTGRDGGTAGVTGVVDDPAATEGVVSRAGRVRAGAAPEPAPHVEDCADDLRQGTCHVPGVGPLEPATAARLSCTADLLGAVVDRHGDVLALGRSRRLVSRRQRRALMVRDRMCQYPGCSRTRGLDAHHVLSWLAGGRTDLDNLILLCRRHHTFVHEGGIQIASTGQHLSTGRPGWQFSMPDGEPVAARPAGTGQVGGDEPTLWKLQRHAEADRAEGTLSRVTSMADPAADAIVPGWRGELFSLPDCVAALFSLRPRPTVPPPLPGDVAAA